MNDTSPTKETNDLLSNEWRFEPILSESMNVSHARLFELTGEFISAQKYPLLLVC